MNLSVDSTLKFIESNIVWGIPLIVLILGVGIILSLKLKGLQLRKLPLSLKYMVTNEEGHKGEVSSFAALCISMAATLGTGKIIGVATAIYWGGPGALFWMILAALFGMATKYCEGFLAIRFRRVKQDEVIGGPFTYIEDGMGHKWKWLAISFAIFASLAGALGIGTMTQMNSITESFVSVFDPSKTNTINILGSDISIIAVIIGIIVTTATAFSVIGGIGRISKVSVVLVPFMAVSYLIVCLLVVFFNLDKVPSAIGIIFQNAFSFKAGFGAAAGFGIVVAMREGVSKGIFSNEAGLGSSPIALASAETDNPVRSGLVNMSGTFIDTMVLCLAIGLGIVITGSYQDFKGIDITINTFQRGLGISNFTSSVIVMLSVSTFAFTTIIGWNVYGEKCVSYLTNNNKKWIMGYKILYVFAVAIAPYLTLDLIWTISSIFNGLMAIPNLIALLTLSSLVAKETKEYFSRQSIKAENSINN